MTVNNISLSIFTKVWDQADIELPTPGGSLVDAGSSVCLIETVVLSTPNPCLVEKNKLIFNSALLS